MIAFHALGFDTLDLKSLVKFTTSRFNHFIAIKEIKIIIIPFFPHSLASRTYRDITNPLYLSMNGSMTLVIAAIFFTVKFLFI